MPNRCVTIALLDAAGWPIRSVNFSMMRCKRRVYKGVRLESGMIPVESQISQGSRGAARKADGTRWD